MSILDLPRSTQGFSEEAIAIVKLARGIEKSAMERSSQFRSITGALMQLWNECQHDDWDGYGATPVLWTTIQQAGEFCRMLPIDISTPHVSAEPDGAVALDWGRSGQVVSASVMADGSLHFAAIFGLESYCGSIPQSADPTDFLIYLIRKACKCSTR